MFFFKMLKYVHNEIKSIKTSFFELEEEKKIVWIVWERICKSKSDGGLEVIDFIVFNIALLAKWNWRLGIENIGFWK